MKNCWRVDYFENGRLHKGLGMTRCGAVAYMRMLLRMGIKRIYWGHTNDGLSFSGNLHNIYN